MLNKSLVRRAFKALKNETIRSGATIQLTTDQEIRIDIGHAAAGAQIIPQWYASDPAVVTIDAAPDGRSAVVRAGALGQAKISIFTEHAVFATLAFEVAQAVPIEITQVIANEQTPP